MTPARLAARCVELLGAVDGPVAVQAPPRVVDAVAARLRVAGDDGSASAALCVFLGEPIDTVARAARVEGLAGRLAAGALLVVVDHNQPRARWRRLAGMVMLALHGHGPARARHPVAREIRDRGFVIERLCLDAGERVQLVLARRR